MKRDRWTGYKSGIGASLAAMARAHREALGPGWKKAQRRSNIQRVGRADPKRADANLRKF